MFDTPHFELIDYFLLLLCINFPILIPGFDTVYSFEFAQSYFRPKRV